MPDYPELPEIKKIDMAPLREARESLQRAREELAEPVGDMRDSAAELHREPRADLSVPESELRWIVNDLAERALIRGSAGDDFRERVKQALAIESGPGGKFDTGGTAA